MTREGCGLAYLQGRGLRGSHLLHLRLLPDNHLALPSLYPQRIPSDKSPQGDLGWL